MGDHLRWRGRLLFCAAFLAMSLVASLESSAGETAARGKFVPPEGKALLIVGQDQVSTDDYVNSVGIVPAGTMLYTSVQEADGLAQPVDHGGGLQHGQYLVDKYPDTAIQVGLWMVDALEAVRQGKLDEKIDALGEWIRKAGRPVFLRIGYEFDFPANHYDPPLYVQAYRHIVDRLRQNGVENVAFVWHSYANLPEHPWADWYPGDDYVDWVGISVFGKPNVYMNKLAEFAEEHGKPLMVAESTPFGVGIGHGAASWQNWFEPFFRFVEEKGVKAISYIDCDWESVPMFKGQGWGDARVQANETVKAKWIEEIRKDKYLQSSPELYKALGYMPAAPAASANAAAATPAPISAGDPDKVVEARGGRVKVVKYRDGRWQLQVDGKPYFIKGVMFVPVNIGEDPGSATMRDWMYYDDNKDGINDIAFQTWLDKNKNNQRDPDEGLVGDFQLMKDLGVNTIRLYHVASNNSFVGDIYKRNASTAIQFDHAINKELLRKLYQDYGIRVMMGSFLGAWTIGSGAAWEEGTDYTNPQHRQNIKDSVKAMILDNKDEPYVLMWVLGNENNLGSWTKCNAAEQPEAYAKLLGEIADMIHQLDPEHPVAVCDGDSYNTLHRYAQYAQGIDIVGFNSYRGPYGFGNLWVESKKIFDRPVFISEFGIFAYNAKKGGEDEELQANYIRGCWQDIAANVALKKPDGSVGGGNSIGGVVFDWLDRWYMDGTPAMHNPGTRSWQSPDGLRHEEWFGIMSMGDGKDTLLRQKRQVYDYLAEEWNRRNSP